MAPDYTLSTVPHRRARSYRFESVASQNIDEAEETTLLNIGLFYYKN